MSAQAKKTKEETTTLSVRIPISLDGDLTELATHTNRSKSYLAGQAIKAYVAHELKICRMLKEGLDDLEAGRTHSHEDVMAEVDDIINKYK